MVAKSTQNVGKKLSTNLIPMASERIYITKPGEYYMDALTIEAYLKNNTVAGEAKSLLCARLMQRKEYREEMLDWLAHKRGITRQEMIDLILSGQADKLSASDLAELKAQSANESVD